MSKLEQAGQKKQHYFMSAGMVTFSTDRDPEMVSTVSLNAVICTASANINTRELASIQRQMQMQLHARAGESTVVEVVDVIITNISPLGFMTPDEFMQTGAYAPAPPPDMPKTSEELVQALADSLPQVQ